MNIYELTNQLLDLQEMLEDEDVDQEVLRDTLDAVSGEYDEKLENYCKIIRNLEALRDGIVKERVRLASREKTIQNNIDKMKTAMHESMVLTGRTTAGGKQFKVFVKKNGGKLPIVLDVPVEELPPDLVRYKMEADNDAIRKYLDEGVASPWCHYGERGEHLEVK